MIVTVQTADAPPAEAVMRAVPTASAVTSPFSTEAREGSELLQAMDSSVFSAVALFQLITLPVVFLIKWLMQKADRTESAV